MALTARGDFQLKQKAKKKIQESNNPVEKLRLQCLARGGSGILGLGRYDLQIRMVLLSRSHI